MLQIKYAVAGASIKKRENVEISTFSRLFICCNAKKNIVFSRLSEDEKVII